jgi:hypothetical protein
MNERNTQTTVPARPPSPSLQHHEPSPRLGNHTGRSRGEFRSCYMFTTSAAGLGAAAMLAVGRIAIAPATGPVTAAPEVA